MFVCYEKFNERAMKIHKFTRIFTRFVILLSCVGRCISPWNQEEKLFHWATYGITNSKSLFLITRQEKETDNPNYYNKTLRKATAFLRTLGGEIKIGQVTLRGLDGLKGDKGDIGPQGKRGHRGYSGLKGAKGEKGSSCDATKCKSNNSPFKLTPIRTHCLSSNQGTVRYDSVTGNLQLCHANKWSMIGGSSKPVKPANSCFEILFSGQSKGDGLYWLNPSGHNDVQNAFQAYCDMSTAGGGWTLVAKVTNDYSWVCPHRKGGHCFGSLINPAKANLFHRIHERDLVDLTLGSGSDTGVHMNLSKIRHIFANGRKSIRFTFVTSQNDWKPSDDVYAVFNPAKTNGIFLEKTSQVYYKENLDYTWNVIKQTRVDKLFSGEIICWGNKANSTYRFYEGGLHFGTPASGDKPCLLANDENEIMLKSHYAIMAEGTDKARWDSAQFGLLGAYFVQAPCKRIAIWVR